MYWHVNDRFIHSAEGQGMIHVTIIYDRVITSNDIFMKGQIKMTAIVKPTT